MTDDGTAAPRATHLCELTGRTALVTGGGRGIGRMCIEGLLRAGVRVLIASRRLDDCRWTADELRHLGEVVPLQADLATYPETGWDKVLAVNLSGPFFLVQALLPESTYACSASWATGGGVTEKCPWRT
ncbi:SDR family NAD(P)-dependent oxidoreductase [Nocardioides zeae]|uniref:NAD(P)-dependent dehydrogenase (Short-subunit alcohol dehydrogenase family) n=1 Tax=Nocardioides zeae TaxID=1457234 RepID=A0AAJ1X1Z6_9ACTN|nr:SDR family NAD(P)-dependent oxidoreductase [Nocardioides zeae]MDQ1105411.1 NAD(P)-dependent dehydrogenase (short-subunit alcohol dehydrogenase family) [Nocardioides zeae]